MKLTKRGKRVRAVVILIGLYLIWQVATHLWWVGIGSPSEDFIGYCWGSFTQCNNW